MFQLQRCKDLPASVEFCSFPKCCKKRVSIKLIEERCRALSPRASQWRDFAAPAEGPTERASSADWSERILRGLEAEGGNLEIPRVSTDAPSEKSQRGALGPLGPSSSSRGMTDDDPAVAPCSSDPHLSLLLLNVLSRGFLAQKAGGIVTKTPVLSSYATST